MWIRISTDPTYQPPTRPVLIGQTPEHIFSQARAVIIWLGTEREEDADAPKMIQNVSQRVFEELNGGYFTNAVTRRIFESELEDPQYSVEQWK
jgi:hypothetical protein